MDSNADDIASRREARKRKILENAENRLGKIAGREVKSTVKGTMNN